MTHRCHTARIALSLVSLAALLGAIAPSSAAPTAQFDPASFSVALEEVAGGFDRPLQVADPGDGSGRLFVVEQIGHIHVVRDGDLVEEPFLDIGGQISGGNEQGLLSMAFHPEFAENGAFYINYTDSAGNTQVEEWRVAADDPDRADPASARTILSVEQPFANHNGGLVLFGPDGHLYIGLGDGGSQGDPNGNAQNTAEPLGSILRIAVDPSDPETPYTIPEDNPFADGAEGMPEIWVYGLRNPWRFSFDRESGDLFIGDVGGSAYEEVNYRPAGEAAGSNFGWDIMEGPDCHEPADCDPAGLVMPAAWYETRAYGCAITGGYVYRGEALPDLAGVYLFADYCSGLIWGMGQDASDAWVVSEPIETGISISSFGEDADGELYVTDLGGGAVYRIVAG